LAAATSAFTRSVTSSNSATAAAWAQVELVPVARGSRQLRSRDGAGGPDVAPRQPEPLGDLGVADAEQSQLLDDRRVLADRQRGPVGVLGSLPDQPLDLGGAVGAFVTDDLDRHGGQTSRDRPNGAPVAEPDPELPIGGPYGGDGLQQTDILDAGDEVSVRLGRQAHVLVQQQRARVELLHDPCGGPSHGRAPLPPASGAVGLWMADRLFPLLTG
jgi:hypothetical protein